MIIALPFGRGVFGAGPLGGYVSAGLGVDGATTITGNACELAIDEATGDIAMPPRLVRGPDAIIQRARSRLRFFSGEWFLDRRLGTPYFDQILVKNPRLPVVNSIFRKVIGGTPGVVSVPFLAVKAGDAMDRRGTVDFEGVLDDGSGILATAEPFIVRERARPS